MGARLSLSAPENPSARKLDCHVLLSVTVVDFVNNSKNIMKINIRVI